MNRLMIILLLHFSRSGLDRSPTVILIPLVSAYLLLNWIRSLTDSHSSRCFFISCYNHNSIVLFVEARFYLWTHTHKWCNYNNIIKKVKTNMIFFQNNRAAAVLVCKDDPNHRCQPMSDSNIYQSRYFFEYKAIKILILLYFFLRNTYTTISNI